MAKNALFVLPLSKTNQIMKKFLLLLTLPLFFACSSSDDEEVIYNETNGYLTTQHSVEVGIKGTWQVVLESGAEDIYFKYDGSLLHGGDTPSNFTQSHPYYIKKRENGYHIYVVGDNRTSSSRISKLTRSDFQTEVLYEGSDPVKYTYVNFIRVK